MAGRCLSTSPAAGTLARRTDGLFACAVVAAVLIGGLGGAAASHAGVRSRAGTIAFVRGWAGDRAGLFAIEADGSGLRRLTPSGLNVASFEWAPDGSRIAYLDRRGALRLVRPDGTGGQLLAASSRLRSPWFLSWSPDGKAIAVDAFDRAAEPTAQNYGLNLRIFVIPTDGGVSRRLPSGDAQTVDWSPRGDEIAYGDGSGRSRLIRTDGSKAQPFFPSPPKTGALWGPTWSPEGAHVGFVASVQHGHGRHVGFACGCSERYDAIYVADADGSNLHLVTSYAYTEYGFAWSPDGRWMLYGRTSREGIYVIGADGHNNHRLTRDSPTPSLSPALSWAPDGRSIAYETDRTGNGDIYIIGADGHNKLRLTNSAAVDGDPSWQPQ